MHSRGSTLKGCLVLVTFCATHLAQGGEAAAEYYNPANKAISAGDQPPTVWETPPKKTRWAQPNLSVQHVEEMRGLLDNALRARLPGREGEYALSTARGSVGIRGPQEIRDVANEVLSALMAARRMELGLVVEHYALSRAGAARMDGQAGAVLDEAALKWLQAEAQKGQGGEAVLLGRLAAAGIANDAIVADSTTPVPVAYLRHEPKSPPELTYLSVIRGGWFTAQATPAGAARWSLRLRALLAWSAQAVPGDAEVALPVGQTAVARKAVLQLPRWRSLACRTELVVASGSTVLVALAGASDDAAPSAPGKPFEALVLRIEDPLSSTASGPVALCFDGANLDPARVLLKMRELAPPADTPVDKKPPLKAWCAGSMLLLNDASQRDLCLQALKGLQPADEPQRLRVILGAAVPADLPLRAAALDNVRASQVAQGWWAGEGLVSVAEVAAASGRTGGQLDLQMGEVNAAGIGLAQKAVSDGIELTAGCQGTGRRRRLAVTAALGVPHAGLGGISTSVSADRQLNLGVSFFLPSGGRAPNGGLLVSQLGPLVDAESEAGTISEWTPSE